MISVLLYITKLYSCIVIANHNVIANQTVVLTTGYSATATITYILNSQNGY